MKKKNIVIIAVSIFLGIFVYISLSKVQAPVNDNSPEWVPIHEAQEVAAATDKLIFVDVYEIGCKYCRAMDREVFPDSTVRQVLDASYIPVRIDGNSTETIRFNGEEIPSIDFAQSKGAYVFPTSLILDAEGNVIKKKTGYMGVDEFRQFLYQ
ncbi:MAG TPA: thioredoxin fold domain-containing protein [Gracilimonas sp.]|uniref:thioredoxin family protein n=1 Tax=Gracilimonas sp. TaxID=1974203 RepID=UPI002D8ED11D|nr:thioredoxin fold domain-containing protein [Gracilimonas sp.]